MSQSHDYNAPDLSNQYQSDVDSIRQTLNALASHHSGNTAPSNVPTGATWLDTSSTPYTLKELDSNGNWVDILKLSGLGRDVDNSAGTRDSLDQRISESLNDDGTLKTNVSANISEWIDFTESGTNAVDTDTFEVDGDHVSQFYPDNEKGRMAKIEQPNRTTTYAPVEDATYDSNANTTTVNLITGELTNTLASGTAIDNVDYGTVGPSDEGGLPYIQNDKLFLGDGTETDSGIRVGAFNLPFDDTNTSFSATDTQTAIEQNDNAVQVKENYLPSEGLVIKNNSSNSNTQIDIDTGGQLWVHDPADDTTGSIIKLNSGTGDFDISTTGAGGLINNSSRSADTWYELGPIYNSSDGSKAIAGWTDSNRPTSSSDLPGSYNQFRSMGTPGKTWWVRTDGSQNIYQFNHQSDGHIIWGTSLISDNAPILDQSTVPTSTTSVGVSNFVPPQSCFVQFSRLVVQGDGGGQSARIGISYQNEGTIAEFNFPVVVGNLDTTDTTQSPTLPNVDNQEIFYKGSGDEAKVIIYGTSSIKAVK